MNGWYEAHGDPAKALAHAHRLSPTPSDVPRSLGALALVTPWLTILVRRCRLPDKRLARATDWILDNDYRLHRALRQVRRDLPAYAFARLPALERDSVGDGDPRALVLGRHLLDDGAPRVEPDRLLDWLNRYQDVSASRAAHSVSGGRAAFVGERGDLRRPAALGRTDLGGQFAPGADACGAWQVHLDLAPGERTSVVFIVGEGETRAEAAALLGHWRDPARVDEALAALAERWDHLTGAVRVRSPDPAFDLMIDRWLVYQSVSSRLFARAGFYQASGAFGFRDQLQDSLALLAAEPRFARDRLLDAATRQFEAGDVLHWWHPPLGRGIRTRCSDDMLWLAYVTARYVERTGDAAFLDVELPFLDAPELGGDEADRYAVFETGASGTVFEHGARALERGIATGVHGLPLTGGGDWNDGMDRGGRAGRGESVWLGWFRIAVIALFAPLAEGRGEGARAVRWRTHGAALERAIADTGWDGRWFLRAFDDEGLPWGSATNEECRIDVLAQAWSALADCPDTARVRQALASADARLVDRDARLVRLLAPPFHDTPREPGYIKSYPPGIRENGGQYTHGGAWLGLAWARVGEGERAHEVFDLLCAVRRAATPDGAEHYRTEPCVLAADVGGVGAHQGVGGWSWYTGAAGWVWLLGVRGILGIEHLAEGVRVTPTLPRDWDLVEVMLRSEAGTIALRLEQVDGERDGILERRVDDTVSAEALIRFPEKGAVRRATVVIERRPLVPAGARSVDRPCRAGRLRGRVEFEAGHVADAVTVVEQRDRPGLDPEQHGLLAFQTLVHGNLREAREQQCGGAAVLLRLGDGARETAGREPEDVLPEPVRTVHRQRDLRIASDVARLLTVVGRAEVDRQPLVDIADRRRLGVTVRAHGRERHVADAVEEFEDALPVRVVHELLRSVVESRGMLRRTRRAPLDPGQAAHR